MPTTQSFGYTGAVQTFTVPAGVTTVTVDLIGASSQAAASPSLGGRVQGDLTVTPGQVLNIYVGGQGGPSPGTAAGAGGFNGGGSGMPTTGAGASNSGNGGGGATDIRVGGTALANRVAVAGGAGGDCVLWRGGPGGAGTGGAGTNICAGQGGTQSAGGAAGAGVAGPQAGSLGQGGNGGGANAGSANPHYGSGGGGGGYYGGGAGSVTAGTGANQSGGGGGSNYVGGLATVANNQQGSILGSGNGQASLTFNQPPTASASLPGTGTYIDPAVANNFQWSWSDPDATDTTITQAQIRYRQVGTSPWTTLTFPGNGTLGVIAAAAFTAGLQYEWQVAVTDPGGLASAWSSSNIFNAVAAPSAPTITAPISSLSANPVTVAWTPSGTESYWDIRVLADVSGSPGAVLQSGTYTTGSATSTPLTLTGGSAANGAVVHFEVRTAQYMSGSAFVPIWSAWGDSGAVTVNLGPPGVPTLALSVDPVTGSITVAATNPATPNTTSSQDLYRTDLSRCPLRIDWAGKLVPPALADTLQPIIASGTPVKMQSGTLALNYAGSGAQTAYVKMANGAKVMRARGEFLFESAAWSTDGATFGLLLADQALQNGHAYFTTTRTGWTISVLAAGSLTTVSSGSYGSALPLDTLLSVEIAIDTVTAGAATLTLPDGIIRSISHNQISSLIGNYVYGMLAVAAANTDRRPRLANLLGSDLADFGEIRIQAGMAPNASYTDYTPASDTPYRYRTIAMSATGGVTSSA